MCLAVPMRIISIAGHHCATWGVDLISGDVHLPTWFKPLDPGATGADAGAR